MLRHRLSILLLVLLMGLTGAAQKDSKAKELLDKVAATYNEKDGMKISFRGTQHGTIWLNGNRFVLDCGGIKSWFDGRTLWSYVAENEEVNVSSPTPEELQTVNPYMLVTMYRNGFNYSYNGLKIRNGKNGEEVILIPENNQDIRMIILTIDSDNVPFYIGVDMQNGHYEEFILATLEKVSLSENFFQFDQNQYPNAEIIDLR